MLNLKKPKVFLPTCLAICILWLMGQGTAAATEPDPIALQLLVEMWEKNTKNREGSVTLFERQGSASEQVLMAYTLNRMKHNRYRDARVPAGELTNSSPGNLDGWMLRIWLDTVTNKYDQGLIGIRLMKRQMDQQPDLTDSQKEKYYERLARIIGYLQGPVATKTDQATLNDTITKLVEGMTPEQLRIFNDQRTAILDEYDQYIKDAADLATQEKNKTAAEALAETQTIQTQNQALDARLQQIQPEKDRLQIEAEQKVSTIESQLAPLRLELATHITTVRAIESSLQVAYSDLNLEQVLLSREEDPNLRSFIARRINRINITINNIQSDLIAANARATGVRAQVRQLAGELARTNRTYQNQIDQLSEEQNQVSHQQRRNASRLGKIAKGSNATSAKVRSAEIEIESLRTYDPFPLELARQDYLDSLSAKE